MKHQTAVPSYVLQQLLQQGLPRAEWSITRPVHGQQKECYIAQSRDQTVFLKFEGAPIAILQRLSDLGVSPRLLAGGECDGRRYAIHEYLAGEHPWGWRWFPENLPLLAETTRRYHCDRALRQLLAEGVADYHEQVDRELAGLERQLDGLAIEPALRGNLAAALAELQRQAQQLRPVELAPVHGDPNGLNFILTRGRLLLVDWDDIALADPMREIGQWLCWYVGQEQWPVFFARYRCTLDQALTDRLFWWAVRASFANAVWHLSRQYPHQVFVRDCWDALEQRMTPHQVFAGT
jgi:hypothetical protein